MINESDSKSEPMRKISQWKKIMICVQILTMVFALAYFFCSYEMQTASLKFIKSSNDSVQALQSKFLEQENDLDKASLGKLLKVWTEGTLKANQYFSDSVNERLQADEICCLVIVGINLFGMICLWRGLGCKSC